MSVYTSFVSAYRHASLSNISDQPFQVATDREEEMRGSSGSRRGAGEVGGDRKEGNREGDEVHRERGAGGSGE